MLLEICQHLLFVMKLAHVFRDRRGLVVENMREIHGRGDVCICFPLGGTVDTILRRSLEGIQGSGKVRAHHPGCGVIGRSAEEHEDREVARKKVVFDADVGYPFFAELGFLDA
jgi:hypothetical protein